MNHPEEQDAQVKEAPRPDAAEGDGLPPLEPLTEKEMRFYLIQMLEKMRAGHQGLEQKLAFNQKRLDMEVRCNLQRMKEDRTIIEALRAKIAEHEAFTLKVCDSFSNELHAEKEKSLQLSEELENMRAINEEIKLKCKMAQEAAAHLHTRVDTEIKSVAEQVEKDHLVMEGLAEGMKAVSRRMEDESPLTRQVAHMQEHLISEVQTLRKLVDKHANPEFHIEIRLEDLKRSETEVPEDASQQAAGPPKAGVSAWERVWHSLSWRRGAAPRS